MRAEIGGAGALATNMNKNNNDLNNNNKPTGRRKAPTAIKRNNFKRTVGASRRKRPSSSYRGVTWNKWHQKWTSQIRYNGKQHHLGVFIDPIVAAKKYDEAALKHHAAKAVLNFPEEAKAKAEADKAKEKMGENTAGEAGEDPSLESAPLHVQSRPLNFLQASATRDPVSSAGRNAQEQQSDAEVMARKRSRVEIVDPTTTTVISDPMEDLRQLQLQQTLQYMNSGMRFSGSLLMRNNSLLGGLLQTQPNVQDATIANHTSSPRPSSLLHSSYAYTADGVDSDSDNAA